MNDKTKPRTFRIDDTTVEKFKEIAQEIKGNQQQTMEKLLEAYKLCQSMNGLPERKADIETFQQYLSILSTQFLNVVNEAITAKSTARADFASELERNEQTITDLQALIKDLKGEKSNMQIEYASAIEKAKQLEIECLKLQKSLDDATTKHAQSIKDKEKLNAALSETNDALRKELQQNKDELNGLNELREHCSSLEGEVGHLKEALKTTEHKQELELAERKSEYTEKLLTQKADYEAKLNEMRSSYSQKIEELTGELLTQKTDYEEKMNKLRDTCSQRIEEAQSKYMMLMEQNIHEDKKNKE